MININNFRISKDEYFDIKIALFSKETGVLVHNADLNKHKSFFELLDALVLVPFSKLRANQRPMMYAAIKIGNVIVNLVLNIFFLMYLPKLAASNPNSVWDNLYVENFQIAYIFIANLLASLATFVVLSPNYLSLGRKFDPVLWKKMMKYGLPILVAGLAFAVNEHFDKISI